jgi:hypothetical protein
MYLLYVVTGTTGSSGIIQNSTIMMKCNVPISEALGISARNPALLFVRPTAVLLLRSPNISDNDGFVLEFYRIHESSTQVRHFVTSLRNEKVCEFDGKW